VRTPAYVQVGEQPLLGSEADDKFETEEEEAAWIVEQSLRRFWSLIHLVTLWKSGGGCLS
jgi:hypothetical protein